MDNQREIIIPPPLAFRDTSVFVKCNPNDIDFKKELSRWLKCRINSKDNYSLTFCKSLFGKHNNMSSISNFWTEKDTRLKPIESINDLHLRSYENQYCGYSKGIDRCGIEVFYIRAGKKDKNGKTLHYCVVDNRGIASPMTVGVYELKQYCKENGIKGYSKCKKDELVKLLMSI